MIHESIIHEIFFRGVFCYASVVDRLLVIVRRSRRRVNCLKKRQSRLQERFWAIVIILAVSHLHALISRDHRISATRVG